MHRKHHIDPRLSAPRRRRQPRIDSPGCGFWLWAVFCALLGLGMLGVIVWAIVRFTLHFTS